MHKNERCQYPRVNPGPSPLFVAYSAAEPRGIDTFRSLHSLRAGTNKLPRSTHSFENKKTGVRRLRCASGVTGIEPAISGLTGRRDNQLRHTPTERFGKNALLEGFCQERGCFFNTISHLFLIEMMLSPNGTARVLMVRSEKKETCVLSSLYHQLEKASFFSV